MRLCSSGAVTCLPPRHKLGYVGRLPNGRIMVITRAPVGGQQIRNFVFQRTTCRHWKPVVVTGNGGYVCDAAAGTHYHRFVTVLGEFIIRVRAEGGGWRTKGPKADTGSTFAEQPLTPLWIPDDPWNSGL